MKVQNNINECYPSGRRQRIIDDRHETNINDHKSSNIGNFVIEIRSLHKGKQSQYGDKNQRDKNGECIHNRVFVKRYIEGYNLKRSVLSSDILANILR